MSRERRAVRMSDPWVKAVKPAARPIDYRDSDTRGLVLRVHESGRRTWAVRYVFAGQPRRHTIGLYPEVSLAEARKKAEAVRGAAHLGSDVEAQRRKLRLGETFAEVAAAWLRSEDTRHWRSSSRSGFELQLRRRLLPKLGPMKLAEVQRAHVQAVLDDVDLVHTRNRVFETARMLFGWAVKRELLDASPCAGIEKLREARRTRTLTDEEIRQVIGAFDGTRLGRFVRLLFLTGVRRDEALGMRWADVDRDRGLWTIAPESEKTGETRGEARRVALSRAALELLAVQRERNMSHGRGRAAFVFAGPDGQRLERGAPKPVIYRLKGMRDNGTKPRQHRLAKPRPVLIAADFRLHDIRRTVADRMLNELSVSAYVVDVGVLGHAKPKMLGTYAPSVPLKELRDAMERWATELQRILGRDPAGRTIASEATT